MVWSALKEARSNKKDLASVWLDIANAYGSIPHRLIFFALKRYGVSNAWILLIQKYYDGLFSKSFSNAAPSDWHQHFKGIFTGCTLSIILFLSGMNVIIEYTILSKAKAFNINSVSLSLVRAFMDDLNLLSTSVQGTQDLLERCTKALTWAGMVFRPDKSRSIVIVKGKSLNCVPFVLPDSQDQSIVTHIPTIHTRPVKFLGRIIDGSISDRKSIDELQIKLTEGLSIIDRSFFTGVQKVWILQHLLIPRIQWALLIYEVSFSLASSLQQKVSVYIRKWLHLHHSTSDLCLYSDCSPCSLPIKSLTSILKSSKISGHLLLRDSKDSQVAKANPKIKCGRLNIEKLTEEAEAEMKIKEIIGSTTTGKHGLGWTKNSTIPSKRCRKIHYFG